MTATEVDPVTFTPTTVAGWRAWLAEHGRAEREVWLVIHHVDSATSTIRIHEAVEQALCFGWIDGIQRTRDADSTFLRFTPRRPRSSWSKVNCDRAARLMEAGLMTDVGVAAIDAAKAAGTWQVLPDDQLHTVPADLAEAFDGRPGSGSTFAAFPPTSRRLILLWIAEAKRPETRARRIAHTAALAADGIRANHPGAPPIGPRSLPPRAG